MAAVEKGALRKVLRGANEQVGVEFPSVIVRTAHRGGMCASAAQLTELHSHYPPSPHHL